VKCRSRSLAVYSNELILGTVGSARIGSDNHRETTKSLQICYLFNSESVIPISQTSMNWNDASSASGPLWVTRLLTVQVGGVSIYALAFVLEADILSTGLNKDCVMWHVRQWLFWETITVSHVCCYSVNHSNAHFITALTAQSDTSNIPQGSASTYFKWSGHFRHSFVKGFFWDNPSNFYWNRFIFDRQGAKTKFAKLFLRHGVVADMKTAQ